MFKASFVTLSWLNSFKESTYFSIVAMGGDGTANKVIDSLLTHSQRDYDIEPKPGFNPVRAKLPVGIIPCGNNDFRS